MNKKTRKAAKELTVVANVIFTCGLIIGSILVILGIFSISTGQNSNFSGVLSLSGISSIIVGIIIMLIFPAFIIPFDKYKKINKN